MENALRRAGLSHSTTHKDYAARRLAEGSDEYGETQFYQADCAAEGAEEAIDGANWTGFEWVKRWEEDTLDESCEYLTRAGADFASAFENLRRYLQTRPDEST